MFPGRRLESFFLHVRSPNPFAFSVFTAISEYGTWDTQSVLFVCLYGNTILIWAGSLAWVMLEGDAHCVGIVQI